MAKNVKPARKSKSRAKKAANAPYDSDKAVRQHLAVLLSGSHAHVWWKNAFAGVPANLRGVKPGGLPYSLWQLLEHIRISQWDILEFTRDSKHVSPHWPSGYWPSNDAPPSDKAWDDSTRAIERGLEDMKRLALNPKTNLYARIPHGTGQTILRELLLLADHNAYHTGQAVLVRRLLGIWESS
ncbi:MAG: DinB family protein [Candidatus Acidiferrales bacterium]